MIYRPQSAQLMDLWMRNTGLKYSFVYDILNILFHATRSYNFISNNISATKPLSANKMLDLLFVGMELHYTIVQGNGKEMN